MTRIDYEHDSLCEIVLKQRETIERQGLRILDLFARNARLRQDAELAMSEEHQRYAEVLILLEHWVQAHVAGGHGTVDAAALRQVLLDVFDYAENGRKPTWFGAAVEAMDGAR